MTEHPPSRADAPWEAWARGEIAAIRSADQWRQSRIFDARGPVGRLHGKEIVSFASNDYLGLTTHPAVIAAAHEALDRWGSGAGSARLVVGSRPVHHDLEAALAAWKRTEAVTLFPTGYQANLGVMTTFAGLNTRVLSDELNHASIIDGARLSKAEVVVYRHGDVDHVRTLLAAGAGRRSLVVTDRTFSMDGDDAPILDLAAACAPAGALLVLDEAHSVLAPDLDDALLATGAEVLRVGTLSKTLGALGGFVAGSQTTCDLLVNRARSSIFTTALPPAVAAAALAAVGVVVGSEGAALVCRLRELVDRVRFGHPSPIIPVVVGEERTALAAAERLLDGGLLVPAIRPPTVPPGTSRLRIAISAAHTHSQVDELLSMLGGLAADGLVAAS